MTPRTSIARLADDAPVAHANSWPSRPAPSIATAAAYAALEAQAIVTAKALLAAKLVIDIAGYPIRGSQELNFAIENLKAAIKRSEGAANAERVP